MQINQKLNYIIRKRRHSEGASLPWESQEIRVMLLTPDEIATSALKGLLAMTIRRIAMSTCGVLVTTGLTLTLSLWLASCDRQEQVDRSTAGGEAVYMARAVKHEIHAEYLNNYALDGATKAKGLEHLAQSYVPKKWQQNEEYIQEFGYECEKHGFKEFLEQQKLPCEKLNESPIFDHSLNSYVVKCEPKGSYNMWFDYDKKQWNIRL